MHKVKVNLELLDTMLEKHGMERLTTCDKISSMIEIKSKYGIHRVLAFDILKGVRPRIQSAIDKRGYFENQSREVHGDKYSYNNVKFKTLNTKVLITCEKHGDFLQTPDKHLMGRGCPECSKISRGLINMNKSKVDFISKVNKVHNYKYIYTNTTYIGSKENIEVICPNHGKFLIKAGNHLAGCGCRKCSESGRGWKKKDWIEYVKDKSCNLYIIRCYNENESFVKIGITSRKVEERFKRKWDLPYNYEILDVINGTGDYTFSLENYLHSKYRFFNYTPKIKFNGSKKECFSTDILELI